MLAFIATLANNNNYFYVFIAGVLSQILLLIDIVGDILRLGYVQKTILHGKLGGIRIQYYYYNRLLAAGQL